MQTLKTIDKHIQFFQKLTLEKEQIKYDVEVNRAREKCRILLKELNT